MCIEIERQNQILLDKMTSIMNNQFLPVENKTVSKSLNQLIRKKKLIKITLENISLCQRLKQQKSQYNIKLWKNERKKEEYLLKNICEFTYRLKDSLKNKARKEKNAKSESILPSLKKNSSSNSNIIHQQVFMHSNKKFLVNIMPAKK